MTIKEFEDEFQKIRARNGWKITLECTGIWEITVYDKATGKELANTGSIGLLGILTVLKEPLDSDVWRG